MSYAEPRPFHHDPEPRRRLAGTFAEAYRRYSARIHARLKLTGHLWQGRFNSTAMDERHLVAAARYVAMNPVAAGMTARAGLALVERRGAPGGRPTMAWWRPRPCWRMPEFAGMLAGGEDEAATRALLASRTTGRPVGAADWIKALEGQTARSLAPAKRGPKPRAGPG